MRKVLLLVALLTLTAGTVAAQAPPLGYIGIWWDEGRSSYCATVPAPFTALTYWVCVLPGTNGAYCVEFAVATNANVITSTQTNNSAIISVAQGTPDAGISICFIECQTNWLWLFNIQIYAMDTNPGYIEIVPHPNVGPPPVYQIANCLPGYPLEAVIKFTHAYMNTTPCPAVGVTSTTWGGIKALYSN